MSTPQQESNTAEAKPTCTPTAPTAEGQNIKRDHRYPHGILLRRCVCDWPEDCRKLTIFWSEFLSNGQRRDGRRAGQIRVPPHKDHPNTPHRRYTQAKRDAYMSYVCGVENRPAEDSKSAVAAAVAAATTTGLSENAAKKKKDRNGQFIALHHFPTEFLKDDGKGLKTESIPLDQAKLLGLPKLDMVPIESDATEFIPEQAEDQLTSEQIALAPRSFNWSSLLVNPKSSKGKGATSSDPKAFVVPSVPWSALMQEYHDAGGKRSTLHYYRRFMTTNGDAENLPAISTETKTANNNMPIEADVAPAQITEEEATKVASLLGRMDSDKEGVAREFLQLERNIQVLNQDTNNGTAKPAPQQKSDAQPNDKPHNTIKENPVENAPPTLGETQEAKPSKKAQASKEDSTKVPEVIKQSPPNKESAAEIPATDAQLNTVEVPKPNMEQTTKPASTVHKAPIPFKKRKVEDLAAFGQGTSATEIHPPNKKDETPKNTKLDEIPGPLKKRKVEDTSNSNKRATRASTSQNSRESITSDETLAADTPKAATPSIPKEGDVSPSLAAPAAAAPETASEEASPTFGNDQVDEMQKELAKAQDLQEKVLQSNAAARQRQRGTGTFTTSRRRKTKLPTKNDDAKVEGKRPRKKRFNL